jgi:hypothetical protein
MILWYPQSSTSNQPVSMPSNHSQNARLISFVTDVFSTRIPSTPVESPFCPRCEASLQASLDFRSNYHIGDSDVRTHRYRFALKISWSSHSLSQEAYRIFQWDVQAYERSHPLACLICEPKIKRIIEDRDSKMRERIWTDASLSRTTESAGHALDSVPTSRIARTIRDFGYDVDLWTWRMQCLGWIIGTLTFYSVGLVGTSKLALAGLVAHRIARNWSPWWSILRFREERMFGEEHWQKCERVIWLLRSGGAAMRMFSAVPITSLVFMLELLVSWLLASL